KTKAEVFRCREKLPSCKELFAPAKSFSILGFTKANAANLDTQSTRNTTSIKWYYINSYFYQTQILRSATMSTESLITLSSSSLFFSFIVYLIAIVPFGIAVKSRKKIAVKIAMTLTIIGFLAQLNYFILRWVASGHAPVSNLNEFLTFFGIMLIGSFLVFYYMYRQPVVGLFLLPVAILIIAYASMFANEVSPLIPALQSHWLTIHVITVATASAVLSVSFVTGLIYLLKNVDTAQKGKRSFFLELVLYFLVVVVGFILVTSAFQITDYKASYQFEN